MAYFICDITDDGQILTPAVGRFRLKQLPMSPIHDYQTIGQIIRLGVVYPVLIPASLKFKIEVPDNTWISYGHVLGHVGACVESPAKTDDDGVYKVHAPSDGFLIYMDGLGKPFKHKGDRVVRGEIIATIELMKIRMDITFQGDDEAWFIGYEIPDSRAVKHGDTICLLGRCKDERELNDTNTAIGRVEP